MKNQITKKELSDLSSDNPKIKYRRAKQLIELSRTKPETVYPHLPFFLTLLKSDNTILKWSAIDIVGRCAVLARKDRFERILAELVPLLNCKKMITTNHAIAALSYIAWSKPEYREHITNELLGVEHYTYDTDECRNIAIGKVIEGIASYAKPSECCNEVKEFVGRQIGNSRPATRKKADKFLGALETAAV